MYIVISASKEYIEDDFEQGEVDPRMSSEFNHAQGIQFDSIDILAEKCYLPKDKEHWRIWDGILQCELIETEDCNQPTESEKARWKAGELKLYSCTYEFSVKEVIDVVHEEMAQKLGITNEKFD